MPIGPLRKSRATQPTKRSDIFAQVAELPAPVLALVDEGLGHLVGRLPSGTVTIPLFNPEVPAGRFPTIAVLAQDRDALTRAVTMLPALKAPRAVVIYLDFAGSAAPPTTRPEWPSLRRLVTEREGEASLIAVLFTERVRSRRILSEFARQLTRARPAAHQGIRVAVQVPHPGVSGYPALQRVGALDEVSAEELPVPPDVLIAAGQPPAPLSAHHVTGRSPYVVNERDPAFAVGPLDGRLLRPTGFDRSPVKGAGSLSSDGDRLTLRLPEPTEHPTLTTDARRAALEQLVEAARPHLGVAITWPVTESAGFARAVAGLAMGGVPLTSGPLPAWAGPLLGDRVAAALAAPVDLADEVAREEHSIVLRRAAHGEFGLAAWRRRVAASAGLAAPATPTVSVVLATKREDLLDHTLAQVRRQRGLDFELVLAPHGFSPDPDRVAELAGPRVRTLLRPQPADTLFGDVLGAAADAASGDLVVKMDDDDWYGPDFLTDLVLARDYSGADIIGSPAECIYLEPVDRTIRRGDTTEEWGRFAAGGTLLLERSLLRSVGGFRPVRRFVDASLLSDVLGGGGTLYRTHGLGYLFRRGHTGHTWQMDLEFFLNPERIRFSWDGRRPSRLLEP